MSLAGGGVDDEGRTRFGSVLLHRGRRYGGVSAGGSEAQTERYRGELIHI